MKFCPACRNMLYGIDEATIDGVKKAVLSCQKCKYTEALDKENPVVYEHVLREDKTASLSINPYLEYDPTLDHLTNIVCPNNDCPSRNGSVSSEVVPVEIDHLRLIWMYKCVNCKTMWKQNSRAS